MNEPGWLTFYTAARTIEQRLGGSQAEAQAKLRRACADEKIRSMKAPYEEPGQLPIEYWKRVAPGEWRKREVDYDGPDADGCAIEVMINETDFQHWLGKDAVGNKPKSRLPRDVAKQAISELYPKGTDTLTDRELVKQVGKWLEQHNTGDISRDTILRAADRK
jgi:hypothetical protein